MSPDEQMPVGPEDRLALFTDLYELSMLQAYFEEGLQDSAVFTLFVRRVPEQRNYLLACGLDTVLEQLERLRFTREDIDYLAGLGRFSTRFLQWLETFRFTGAVRGVREGTPVFANEPILEVRAPLPEAQLVETLIMNQIHLQTVQASKAARLVTAARGRDVVDFGARRMHGLDEHAIAQLRAAGAPIDAFRVGTSRRGALRRAVPAARDARRPASGRA